MIEKAENIRHLAAMKLAGRNTSEATILRIITANNIEPVGVGNKSSALYDVATVEAAIKKHFETKKKRGTAYKSEDFMQLKEEKIRHEIQQLIKENEKKELQIQQLRSKLIEYDEVYNYLVARKAMESAILRKIFLSQMPIEVTGLDPAKAREKGEQYFCEVMAAITKNIEDWEEQFTNDEG